MRIIIFLILAGIILVIIQQSNMIVTEKVMDRRLGVATDHTHIELDNLVKYLQNLPQKIHRVFLQRKHYRESF